MIRPKTIDRSIKLAESVLDFKTRLVTEFCENCANAELIDADACEAIVRKQRGCDFVYPHVGDNLDFLRRLGDRSGTVFHALKRPQDVFCWQFSKKGFFNFKRNIPEIISFLHKHSKIASPHRH